MNKQTSLIENGLIWFGAAVSIAEIATGTYLAPLGFGKGLAAVITGHIIGCIMMFFAGLIGGKTRKSSMDTVKISFGEKGSLLFSILNIIQLAGWSAIMIYDGAIAADGILAFGKPVWSFVTGGMILLWIAVGIKNLGKVNAFAMGGLFVLSIILSVVVFKNTNASPFDSCEAMSFGAAVELSAAMPLSWLPLIADYTREAEKPLKATAVSVISYGVVSCWMYAIGMGCAIFAGEYDIAQIIQKAGSGIAGLLIVVFSTVTTTFLDAYSAGISGESLSKRVNGKILAIAVTAIGILGALFLKTGSITDFLYFIGSVFAPMTAILITDFFILKKDCSNKSFNTVNMCIWLAGFIVYRFLMNADIALGSTLPDMIIVSVLCIAVNKVKTNNG